MTSRFRVAAFSAVGALLLAVAVSGCTGGVTLLTPPFVAPSVTPTPRPAPGPIVDGGARDMARGRGIPQADGSVLYTVVKGDVSGVICDRFGLLGPMDLRYADERDGGGCGPMIYVGDALILKRDPTYTWPR